jgi:hypothetical protein
MPSKKGSRVAASQARAKTAAKKKARSGGPDLSGAVARSEAVDAVASSDDDELDESAIAVAGGTDEVGDEQVDTAVTALAPVATAPAVRRARGASRRERQAMSVVGAGSLKWELSLIGSTTAVMGVALVVLKLATDIGR